MAAAAAAAPPVGRGEKRKRLHVAKGKNFMGTAYFFEDPPAEHYKTVCDTFLDGCKAFPQFRGVSFQLEKCPTTGRLHIQYNILFRGPVPQETVKSRIAGLGFKPPHCSFTTHPKEAWDYTSKASTRVFGPFSFGEGPLESGTRTDLIGFVNDAKGLKEPEAQTEDAKESFEMKHIHVQARFPRLYEKYLGKYEPRRTDKTRTLLFCGPAGTGKSRFAAHLFAQLASDFGTVYTVSYPPTRTSHIAWFPGYEGHRLALMDEFEGALPASLFKGLTGDGECKVKVGNGQTERQWVVDLLIICSNSSPSSWYGDGPEFFRRYDAVCRFKYSDAYPWRPGCDVMECVRKSTFDFDQVSDELRDMLVSEHGKFVASIPRQ